MRKVIIILAGCIVVLLLGYSGYRGYELWKQNHWMSMARTYGAKGDVHSEYLCLEQALRFNSRNVAACRMMANLAEAAHSPSALTWRKEVFALDPDSLNDRLALAQTAIFARDYATAQSALAGVDAAEKTPHITILPANSLWPPASPATRKRTLPRRPAWIRQIRRHN